MDDHIYDLLDFAADVEAEEQAQAQAQLSVPAEPALPDPRQETLTAAEMEQAAFAFMHSLHPAALAANVPLRSSKVTVNAAAFWKRAGKNGKTGITKSAVILVYPDIASCFADCSDRAERIRKVALMQQQKSEKESAIQLNEPHLAVHDELFDDYPWWDYSKSTDSSYHELTAALAHEQHLLTTGSRMERVFYSGAADFCYIALPPPSDDTRPELIIPEKWGIVILDRNEKMRFKLLREAKKLDHVSTNDRNTLAVNIAVSGSKAARFACGVDNNGRLRRPPRRRKLL